MAEPVIQLQHVCKSFADEIALQPISLAVYAGEFLTLLGPSGCGKTTLLRLMAGFETPDSGRIYIDGNDVTDDSPEQRHVNLVFQSYALFPHMTVEDNIRFGLQCQGLAKDEQQERILEALQRVKLTEFATRRPDQLSGGQRQRVAIARAMVNEPSVLLLDEPLSALDYHLRRSMQGELKLLQKRLDMTFVMVTHDQEEALSLSDCVVVMNHGSIEQIGKPRDIYEEPSNLYVAKFIGEANVFSSEVLQANSEMLEIMIASKRVHFHNPKDIKAGQRVHIVLRPEDIAVWTVQEIDDTEDMLPAVVSQVIYKGSTVDLVVQLDDGHVLYATEFFDEDDEDLEYTVGERVWLQWQAGWEVVLLDESYAQEA